MRREIDVFGQDIFLRVTKLIVVMPTITLPARRNYLERVVLVPLHLCRISLAFERALCRYNVFDLITVLVDLITT